ncbi:M28 family metallopeptidase [Aliiglaciecola sp. M165]|uniref:M28 family metallopeptidase n=1 Tax=Aliiglaciecola sp. M165 TaxID=2593649 RepID=UPI00117C1FBA|nr:M28 family metallopeptidase [Aliiglaciecola sp. M165]TRY29363.1 M28 family peptidase [Aliiglaciecola sp. M165]
MQLPRTLLPLLASAALLTACGQTANYTADTDNFDSVYQNISQEDLKLHTKVLASDEFEGRSPTTAGETKTLEYLVSNFKALGYEPGNGNSFLQAVELMEITADPDMVMTIGENTLNYKEDMVASSKRETTQVNLSDSELVFVGYGVNAPEYNWNDYEGLDVKGKTVVILVNDPGFENPDSGKFQGKTMTYYGRWSYKYEEASRQGAEGAIIVHETAPASYGWSVVANSWSGAQYSLVSKNGNADRVAVEGWITLDMAQKVFSDAGKDFAQEKANALKGPYNTALGLNASVTINSTLKKSVSNNVIATLPGSERADEHIIYTAHWDHLGTDMSKEGDHVYNGAHDNATGTAASIVMAKAFAELDQRPARSITFLVVTAEEQGLLGSLYYAEHPIIPLDKTVANLNMDAMNVLGKTKDVAVVGMGKSELETYLGTAVQKQGRFLTQEPRPEAGYYYRSDHFSFAKVGVPALYAKGGSEPIDEETANYRKRANVIVTGCYHQVCDQFRENWDFGGVQEDTQMFFDVGYQIANSNNWPKWNSTSEFQR